MENLRIEFSEAFQVRLCEIATLAPTEQCPDASALIIPWLIPKNGEISSKVTADGSTHLSSRVALRITFVGEQSFGPGRNKQWSAWQTHYLKGLIGESKIW